MTFVLFYQIFLLPQVKRSVIISNKHGMQELTYELTNKLKIRKLGNIRKNLKTL